MEYKKNVIPANLSAEALAKEEAGIKTTLLLNVIPAKAGILVKPK